ncbi:hypothetical protein BDR04DRAFT_1098115 [Suillus decipiens]|nr:hypothetical protein BDR04DRAFT_1098115 [Suillus decipiens]
MPYFKFRLPWRFLKLRLVGFPGLGLPEWTSLGVVPKDSAWSVNVRQSYRYHDTFDTPIRYGYNLTNSSIH